jgi:hypothetical protein
MRCAALEGGALAAGCWARHGLARHQLHVQHHGLAHQFRQHALDARGVLRANPVQFEAIAHQERVDRALGAVGTQRGGRQGADPGVELLRWQLGGQALAAGLPNGRRHLWKSFSQRWISAPDVPPRRTLARCLSTDCTAGQHPLSSPLLCSCGCPPVGRVVRPGGLQPSPSALAPGHPAACRFDG